MQTCSAVVVSVSRQGLASSGFSGRSTHTAFEGPDLGTRYLYNREIGLIKYDHKEEFMGSWHEVEHHWRDDDGYGNGIPITGACAGHITKKLLPKCATDSVVHDGNVHHFYCGVGITLDVEQDYMTIWHDHLGLVVHFGDNLYNKFQPLQPVNIKCQPCAEHRFYGFHATRVTSAASIRLKYLYFTENAEVELYDNFLVAKCNNEHRVVLLDKTRAPIRPGETEGCDVGDKLNLAYYRIYTAHGPIYISAFVTNEPYFDEYFEYLRNTRSMRGHLHENYSASKSEMDMLSPARLKTLCQQNLECWNVDNEDVSWYTNRFCPDTATSVAPSITTQREEVEEVVETRDEPVRQPVAQEPILQSEEAVPKYDSEEDFSDSVFLPKEPSLAESTDGSNTQEAPVVVEKFVEGEEATDHDKGDFSEKLEFDEDHDFDLDLGTMEDDDVLSKFDEDEAEEQKPVVVEAVLPSDNKENCPRVFGEDQNNTIPTTHLHNLDEKSSTPSAFSMDLFLVAKWRVFQALGRDEMAASFERGHKRRAEIAIKDFVTEAIKPRIRERMPSWMLPRGGENTGNIPPHTPTHDARPKSPPVASVRPIIGLPLGQGAQIPQGMMRQPSAPTPLPSFAAQQPGPSTSSNRRIGIVPRRDSHSATSESGGSSNLGNKLNNTNRSVSSMPAKVKYLDLGPMRDGEDATDYLERVMNETDSNESKITRWVLNQIVTNDPIQNMLKSRFPALHDILGKMYSQPNVVALSCLDALTQDRIDTTGYAAMDRILMERAVLELLKTKSRTIREFIVKELPFIEEMM